MEIQLYQSLFSDIKQKIEKAQLRAVLLVNAEIIYLYWQIGKTVALQQATKGWSAGIIPQLAAAIKTAFPQLKGYSERNLGYRLRFAKEYNDESILPQLVAKLPWGHNILLIEKIKDQNICFWYDEKCIENNWSRDALDTQIRTNLYESQGKLINNFKATLPAAQSDLALQTFSGN